MAYKLTKSGDYRKRRNFSKTKNVLELNDLLEIQKKSYQNFLNEGIKEILNGQEQSLKIYLEDQEITNEKIAILSYIVSVLNKTLNDLKGPIL